RPAQTSAAQERGDLVPPGRDRGEVAEVAGGGAHRGEQHPLVHRDPVHEHPAGEVPHRDRGEGEGLEVGVGRLLVPALRRLGGGSAAESEQGKNAKGRRGSVSRWVFVQVSAGFSTDPTPTAEPSTTASAPLGSGWSSMSTRSASSPSARRASASVSARVRVAPE